MYFIFRTLCSSYRGVSCRSFHVSRPTPNDSLAKFMFHANNYYKMGILEDDLLSEFYPEVVEAIRRLPEEERLQRIYRAIKASQAEVNHTQLPKDQWTKFEDNHHYLQPYLKEIFKEWEEMKEWEANY